MTVTCSIKKRTQNTSCHLCCNPMNTRKIFHIRRCSFGNASTRSMLTKKRIEKSKEIGKRSRDTDLLIVIRKCCDMLKRRFTWSIFPANFFPRLLLRLMHMQMCLLGSWVDAGVVMSQDQGHHGFLHLFPKDGCYVLEVSIRFHVLTLFIY